MSDVRQFHGHEESADAEANAVFAVMKEHLELFAERHHLAVWRYPHRAPIWMFHFLHPAGGFGRLQLCCVRPKSEAHFRAWVSTHWYIDDHEKRLRREYPYQKAVEVEPNSEAVVLVLESQLELLVRSLPAQLVPSEYSFVLTGDGRGEFFVSEFERNLRVPV